MQAVYIYLYIYVYVAYTAGRDVDDSGPQKFTMEPNLMTHCGGWCLAYSICDIPTVIHLLPVAPKQVSHHVFSLSK